jgi:hypothetical protein
MRVDHARRARLWTLGSALCFTGIGWGWTGNAPAFVSPTACFVGSVICAGGALLSARGARHTEGQRASARTAAVISVLLLLVPVALFGLLILLLSTSDGSFFT